MFLKTICTESSLQPITICQIGHDIDYLSSEGADFVPENLSLMSRALTKCWVYFHM